MEYRSIPGYLGYEITKCGILRSLDRTILHSNGNRHRINGRLITFKLPKGSHYYQVHLYLNGKGKLFRIHQLVAMAWLIKPDGELVINHKDGNKFNNHADNLEYITSYQNAMHCKQVLGKNLNISLAKIKELHIANKHVSIDKFIEIIKLNCK